MDKQTLWQTAQPFVLSALRRALTAGAGVLAARGVIESNQEGAAVEIGVSVAIYAATEVWGWWNERGHAMVLAHFAKIKGVTPEVVKATAIAAENQKS